MHIVLFHYQKIQYYKDKKLGYKFLVHLYCKLYNYLEYPNNKLDIDTHKVYREELQNRNIHHYKDSYCLS